MALRPEYRCFYVSDPFVDESVQKSLLCKNPTQLVGQFIYHHFFSLVGDGPSPTCSVLPQGRHYPLPDGLCAGGRLSIFEEEAKLILPPFFCWHQIGPAIEDFTLTRIDLFPKKNPLRVATLAQGKVRIVRKNRGPEIHRNGSEIPQFGECGIHRSPALRLFAALVTGFWYGFRASSVLV